MTLPTFLRHPVRWEHQRRLQHLGFTQDELTEVTPGEQRLIARWLAPPALYAALWITAAYTATAAAAALPTADSTVAVLVVLFVAALLGGLAGLVVIAVDALTRRWTEPSRLLGLAARSALRSERDGFPTRWDARSSHRAVKWAVHRHLERATGHRLSITWGTGSDFPGAVRRLVLAHARGEFVDTTRAVEPPRLGDHAATGLVWATALAPAAAILFQAVI